MKLSANACIKLKFNPFPPRPAKTSPFVILLCLTQGNFTREGKASKKHES